MILIPLIRLKKSCDGERHPIGTMSDHPSDDDSDTAGGPPVPRGAVGYYRHNKQEDVTFGGGASGAAAVASTTTALVGRKSATLGWEGEDLERDRDREHREANHNSSSGVVAAVDLEQFRNYQVGSGYQARGVVRQRTTTTVTATAAAHGAVAAATAGAAAQQQKNDSWSHRDKNAPKGSAEHRQVGTKKEKKHKRRRKRKESADSNHTDSTNDDGILEYLRCDAFRVFRKELEIMLKKP